MPNSEKQQQGMCFMTLTGNKRFEIPTFLPLNLVGRSQERLQVARALLVIEQCTKLRRVLSLQVDGIYLQPPKKISKKYRNNFEVYAIAIFINAHHLLLEVCLYLR